MQKKLFNIVSLILVFLNSPVYAEVIINESVDLYQVKLIMVSHNSSNQIDFNPNFISDNYIEKEFILKKCDFVFGTVIRNYLGSKIIKKGFKKNRIQYNFDFATSHSTGFYATKELINFVGNYDTNFKCSSDYDFYFRMINTKKFLGSSTIGDEIIGEVASGGYSSTLSFFEHLFEEMNIRIKNKQNYFYIGLIFINAIFKNYYNKIKSLKIKKFYS